MISTDAHSNFSNDNIIFELDLNLPKSQLMLKFDSSAKFAFVVHGFIDSYPGTDDWMEHMILEWAKLGVNVCAIDWGELSLNMLNYFWVAQVNTVYVADYVSKVLLDFEEAGVVLADTTFAGHSLGAQISGKVGWILQTMGKQLGKIYGIVLSGYIDISM